MRKQTKIAAGISAAALVAVAGAMTSLAATGWVNEGGSWYYYNTSGDYVTDTWKAYNGQYFYLGDDGEMWTSRLVEDGDDHYYVDANGAMVKNTWVAVPADDDEEYDVDYRWYYFGSTGKAYKGNYGKTINGKKYGFDDDGKMLFGYVSADSYDIQNDDDDPILNCDYYYGTNDDGARHTGWLQYTDALTNHDDDYYWFYFNTSNGKMVKGKEKTINGKKYSFDNDGIMNYKWEKVDATTDTSETQKWYSTLDDGSLAKNKWIWNKPYATGSLDSTDDDYDDETPRWFRTDASGKIIKGQTKKVNSKWYVFDEDGVMRTGLVVLYKKNANFEYSPEVSGAVYIDAENGGADIDMDKITEEELYKIHPGAGLHYFSEDEEKDGSMKTGTMKIELADDEYTFCFAKKTGAAQTGIYSKKLYRDGILQKAGDDKYKTFENIEEQNSDETNVLYLVGTSGSIVKTASKYEDANGKYYIYLKFNKDKNWVIAETNSEDDAKVLGNHKSDLVKDVEACYAGDENLPETIEYDGAEATVLGGKY